MAASDLALCDLIQVTDTAPWEMPMPSLIRPPQGTGVGFLLLEDLTIFCSARFVARHRGSDVGTSMLVIGETPPSIWSEGGLGPNSGCATWPVSHAGDTLSEHFNFLL